MAKRKRNSGSPKMTGNIENSKRRNGIFIGGDPEGLRSLANLLVWLADFDQESETSWIDGFRCHVHLHANEPVKSFNRLTPFSQETEVCRLDGKGTGEFPEKYHQIAPKRKRVKKPV